jgi:hypothetical protein
MLRFSNEFFYGCAEKSATLRKMSLIPLNEVRQCTDEQRRMRPLRAPFTQIFPNLSDAQATLPVTQADCQQKKPTSREIVPIQRPGAIRSCCQKAYMQLRGTMAGNSDARRKRELIRPVGTISREGMPSSSTR